MSTTGFQGSGSQSSGFQGSGFQGSGFQNSGFQGSDSPAAFREDDPAVAVERARTLLGLGRTEAAERELRGVLARDPGHVVAHCLLALALISRRAVDEAVAEAGEAVRLAPDHWYPHHTAGQVLYYADRSEEALRAARAALAIDHGQAQVWELLTRVHADREEWALTAEAARRGLALDPHGSRLTGLLAVALGELGDRAGALAAASDAVRLDPESPSAHLVYGRVHLAFGGARDAARAFREVLRLSPGADQARELLVVALKRRNPLYRAVSRLPGTLGGRWMLALPLIPPLIAVFVLIAVAHWTMWVAESLVTLGLARGSYTRLLFRRGEVRSAALCCAVLLAGAALLGAGVALSLPATGTAGAALLALVTPVQEAAHTAAPRARKVLTGWAGLLASTAAVSPALPALWPALQRPENVPLLAVWAGLGTIWVAAAVRRLLGRVPSHGAAGL
ncbi:tetratricopeptide repeat protein [Streptosporangium sandarakinum]|uniref:tetratricopeptide repeat protein n=1 Tax=Streptosporangium sandarakinum TaxID=1260955 RepID=UPI00371B2D69